METTISRSKVTSPFLVPRRFENSFKGAILKLVGGYIPKWTDEYSLDEWIFKLEAFSQDTKFQEKAAKLSLALVRDVNVHNVYSWKEHSVSLPGFKKMDSYFFSMDKGFVKTAIKDQIDKTTESIVSIPTKVTERLSTQLEYLRSQGKNELECFNLLKKSFIDGIFARVSLISQTNPHQINSELTRARSSDLFVPCFIWSTLHDSFVRHSHRLMDGVTVFWRELPSPEALAGVPTVLGHYAPGNAPNCRCSPTPIVSIDDLFESKSQIKVYIGGVIRFLTKTQFLNVL